VSECDAGRAANPDADADADEAIAPISQITTLPSSRTSSIGDEGEQAGNT
jgi:hypothetical protein